MNIKPMIFNTEMVRALLDGRKVQTRRPMPEWQKPKKTYRAKAEWSGYRLPKEAHGDLRSIILKMSGSDTGWLCPFAAPGDLIYVRETFRRFDSSNECVLKRHCPHWHRFIFPCHTQKWTPSIHAPPPDTETGARVCRIFLKPMQ